MPGLPLGWESDYDGTRWFYTYKPTGHIQYHFPSEGDEFPDFVDALSPAPVLAPEERLESQQQVKRHGSTHHGRPIEKENILPWQVASPGPSARGGGMTSTARPVSFLWEGDDVGAEEGKEEDVVFRPESFMFLGPGTYNDVSPLVDEEEEAARRVVAGDARSKGVSPNASVATTPQVEKSKLEAVSDSPPKTHHVSTTGEHHEVEEKLEPSPAVEETHVIHMIDSRELPLELPGSEPWQDPVGRVPEMATGETPTARIETNPDPVEIGEGRQLTVIEPQEQCGAVELPGCSQSNPSVPGGQADREKNADASRRVGELTAKPVEDDPIRRHAMGQDTDEPVAAKTINKVSKEHVTKSKYQPYKPGQTMPDIRTRRPDEMGSHQSSIQREKSLMMGPGASGGQQLDLNSIPTALHVSKPQRKPVDTSRNKTAPGLPTSEGQRDSPSSDKQEDAELTAQGVAKFPSVLRPARGRASSQPRVPDDEEVNLESLPGSEPRLSSMRPDLGHSRHQSEELPLRTPGAGAEAESSSSQAARQVTNYQHGDITHSQSTPVAPDVTPRAATAIPVSLSAMQRATSVTVRKAVPKRTGPPADQQASQKFEPSGRAFHEPPVPYPGPSNEEHASSRERRHSSFSPSDVSPLESRSSSMSFASPLGAPSPIDGLRRGSSGVSLAQTLSNSASFTPSPSSLTPGSERQSVVSPLASGSMQPGAPRSNSNEGSYFQGSSRGIEQSEDVASSQQWSGSFPALQRSQSMRQTPSPSHGPESPGQNRDRLSVQGPPPQGHSLTSIEEHDENASAHDTVSVNSYSPGLSRRHSMASSPNPSPRPMTQPTLHQQPEAPGNPPHQHSAGSLPPQFQQRPPPHMQGPQHPGNAPQYHPQRPRPAGAPVPNPGQFQYPGHPQPPPGWQPQGVPQNSFPPTLVSVSTAPPTPKEKDKKWTKWFKPTKSSGSSNQPMQPVQMANAPGAPQAPHGWVPQRTSWQQQPQQQQQYMPPGQALGGPPYQAPWSPHHIPPHVQQSLGPQPPQANANKPLPAPHMRNAPGQQPQLQLPHGGPGPGPFVGQSGAAHPQRVSGAPSLPGDASRWSQRPSVDYSGNGWGGDSGNWR